jgi:hypothetical protein
VRSLTDGGVVHVQIAADGAHHHLAGVEPDADASLDPVRVPQLVDQPAQGGLHPKGRVAGAQGVVLVGERSAEECHDAVAHHLVHRALVAVDRLDHTGEHWIEQLPRLLRIAIGE